jgi:multiple sugar transport system substrate-binding protein
MLSLLCSASAAARPLELWIMPNGANPQGIIEETLSGFEAETGLSVHVTVLDWGEAWSRISAGIDKAHGPDVLQLGSTWVSRLASQGKLAPLDDSADVINPQRFLPAAWKSTGIEGDNTIYAVPWLLDVRVLVGNRRLLAEQGITASDVATVEGFRRTLAKLRAAHPTRAGESVYPFAIPGKRDWNLPHNLAPWIWSQGGDFIGRVDGRWRSRLLDRATVIGLRTYIGFVLDGLVNPISVREDNTRVSARFVHGEQVFAVPPSEVILQSRVPASMGGTRSLRAGQDGVVTFPIPAGPAGSVAFVGGTDLAIPMIQAKNRDAIKLLLFLTRADNIEKYAGPIGFPADRQVLRARGKDPLYADLAAQVENGRSYPGLPDWGKVEVLLVEMLGAVWTLIDAAGADGERELYQILVDTSARIDKLLGIEDSQPAMTWEEFRATARAIPPLPATARAKPSNPAGKTDVETIVAGLALVLLAILLALAIAGLREKIVKSRAQVQASPASPRIPFFRSFRFRFVSLLVGTQVLFAVLAGIYALRQRTATEVQKRFVANQDSLKVAASIVRNQMAAFGESLDMLAVTEALSSSDPVAAGQLLKNYRISALFVANERIALYDSHKTMVADNAMVGGGEPVAFPQFDEVERGRVFRGPTHWEHLAPVRTFAVTVQDLARVGGVLAADFSFRRLVPLLSDVRIGFEGYVVLVDHGGTILYHPEARWTRQPSSIAELLGVAGFDANHFAVGEPTLFRWAGDRKVMVNYLWDSDLRTGFFSVQPYAEIESAVRQGRQTVIVLFVVMLLVMSLVSTWLSTVLARPLLVLAEKMTLVREGHWVESGLRRHDEIGRLAEVFDSMGKSIRSSLEQLAAHRDRLEAEVAKRTHELEDANLILQKLSRTDELTGVSNRRDIVEKIRYEIYRTQRNGRPFAFVMGDIDKFKEVNDRYGHDCGDAVLRAVAQAIRGTLRRHDYMARWGGEEFIMVLPEANEEGVHLACERIRTTVENTEIVHGGRTLKVSMTVGAAFFDPRLGAARSLALADKALYQGKQAGRNRVVLWDPADTPTSEFQAAEKERQQLGEEADLRLTGTRPALPDENQV